MLHPPNYIELPRSDSEALFLGYILGMQDRLACALRLPFDILYPEEAAKRRAACLERERVRLEFVLFYDEPSSGK